MSDFAADDLSLPFHLHNFRSMSLHWSELWLVAVDEENSSTLLKQMADTIKSNILYCTCITPLHQMVVIIKSRL